MTSDAARSRVQRLLNAWRANDNSAADGVNSAVPGVTPLDHPLTTLELADAALARAALLADHTDHPAHVVVLGPTQSGKSTVVNALTDVDLAGVSALAGFTIHAHGFAVGCQPASLNAIDAVMAPLQRQQVASHDRSSNPQQPIANLQAYTLTVTPDNGTAMHDRVVVWDTPDFDSMASHEYRQAVLRTTGLADIWILVVSKDKYGDKSVWDLLSILQELGKPLLVVLNKLDTGDSPVVERAFCQRFQQTFNSAPPPRLLLPLYRQSATGNHEAPLTQAIDPQYQHALRMAAKDRLTTLDRSQQQADLNTFVARHWDEWVAPAQAEYNARLRWKVIVDNVMTTALERYDERYIDNPKKFAAFNQTLAELLTLLELPILAASLSRVRAVVTWPVKRLIGAGQEKLGHQPRDPAAEERTVLDFILQEALTEVRGAIVQERQTNTPDSWWHALGACLQSDQAQLAERFSQQTIVCQSAFTPKIQAAAKELYEQLETQPALLNTLRATRATAEAASVALAVKSGGLALTDLVLAPAMLSVTTLLTESALGRYIDTVKRRLKREQKTLMERELFRGVLEAMLVQMPQQIHTNRFFGLDGDDLERPTVNSQSTET